MSSMLELKSENAALREEVSRLSIVHEECVALQKSKARMERIISNLEGNLKLTKERHDRLENVHDSKLREIGSLRDHVVDLDRELFWVGKLALKIHRVLLCTGKAIWVRIGPEGDALVKHLNKSLGPISLSKNNIG